MRSVSRKRRISVFRFPGVRSDEGGAGITIPLNASFIVVDVFSGALCLAHVLVG